MKNTDNDSVKNLGEVSLEWAQKDLTKKEAPFFAAKESGREDTEE